MNTLTVEVEKANKRVADVAKINKVKSLVSNDQKISDKVSVMDKQEKGTEIPGKRQVEDTSNQEIKQLTESLSGAKPDFREYNTVLFLGLTDVAIPAVISNLIVANKQVLLLPKVNADEGGPEARIVQNLNGKIILKILHDIKKVVPDLDRAVFAPLKVENATLTNGRLCQEGMSIHEYAVKAKSTADAISDFELQTHFNTVGHVVRSGIRHEVANNIVDPI